MTTKNFVKKFQQDICSRQIVENLENEVLNFKQFKKYGDISLFAN